MTSMAIALIVEQLNKMLLGGHDTFTETVPDNRMIARKHSVIYDKLPEILMTEVAKHCYSNECWIVIDDFVYDVTHFLFEHPGGEVIIMEHAGRDATGPFNDVGHHSDARNTLETFCIGKVSQNVTTTSTPFTKIT